jgi:hypothetical protein
MLCRGTGEVFLGAIFDAQSYTIPKLSLRYIEKS